MTDVSLALGIDTGGTYTDGVLLDLATGEIKAKADFEVYGASKSAVAPSGTR